MKTIHYFFIFFSFVLFGCAHKNNQKAISKKSIEIDPRLISQKMITAKFPDRSISAIASHLVEHKPFERIIYLFVGNPGIIKIKSNEDYGMKGNFLMRSIPLWLDSKTVVVSVDAPTDQWDDFNCTFRQSKRYAEDLLALNKEIKKMFGDLPQSIIGTSEGTLSAYYAALALQDTKTKVVMTASLFKSNAHCEGLEKKDLSLIKSPLLWVHHYSDPCKKTPYSLAKYFSESTKAPLITVKSDEAGSGEACHAFTRHGFIDAEDETVHAIKNWIESNLVKDVNISN
jgi:hypothetical protein